MIMNRYFSILEFLRGLVDDLAWKKLKKVKNTQDGEAGWNVKKKAEGKYEKSTYSLKRGLSIKIQESYVGKQTGRW
uniref:Uncharacterized protein n=1 Tax=Candidatus Kentrum sp. TC TaxID=2126339 RepID=A0A450YM74_9GAMM|nr:MAG: hypothetical protein BECKTC1821D_GA0114238_101316 [Candidatus Kentron sp. TC]